MDTAQVLEPAGVVSSAMYAVLGVVVIFAVPLVLSYYRARRKKEKDEENTIS
jgi:hypothetical protein